jgi:histidinol dehydrogenase
LTRIVDDLDEARQTLLARRTIGSAEPSISTIERLRTIFGRDLTPQQAVDEILAAVRQRGDDAVREYSARIDGTQLDDLLITPAAREAACRSVPPATLEALTAAAAEIRAFHQHARRASWLDFRGGGATGQLVQPLERVGIYAPGGRAPYPSTVLMAAIPARAAGVKEIVLASPTQANGTVDASILAAAEIADVDRVYQIGGAQAIAALAYGTESVPRVDKIVGPGNLFVMLAKRALYGTVALDGLPGPTECLIVADDTANVRYVAADFVAQAEHDELAQPVLLCTSHAVAERVLTQAEQLIQQAPRRDIILASLHDRGAVVVHPSVDDLIELANDYAPEHLALSIADAWGKLGLVRNAGGVFVGDLSAESIGDYTAGPSHIMPTGGTARFNSPLSLDDFIKTTSVFSFGPAEIQRIGPPAITIARAEGLESHARAIEARLGELDGRP